ncbi:MAG: phosphoglucomutase [Deltaproteobacteria bacterium]|nr:phosphoglucomutase [Deltaproteobacteria bacterium]
MGHSNHNRELFNTFSRSNKHTSRNYFDLIRELVKQRRQYTPQSQAHLAVQEQIVQVYNQVFEEMRHNTAKPVTPVKFGTSGWRGIIGKDLFVRSVQQVAQAIIEIYQGANSDALASALGITNLAEGQTKGCVLGFDNRFGNELLAQAISDVLTSNGFNVYYAGESTTGTLSAAVLELKAAFSINLTPSHNPLDYGGFKFNAADAGPAAPIITDLITRKAGHLINNNELREVKPNKNLLKSTNAMDAWQALIRRGKSRHGLDYDAIIAKFESHGELILAVDCVHGASKASIDEFFKGSRARHLQFFRKSADPTFGGIAPEPSSANIARIKTFLAARPEPLKLGVIMDPDADRIRFTDGETEIDMNKFGAMAYHFLHEIKGKSGLVAKTVATSNFANAMAAAFNEEVFEPRVGFKEFKPVIHEALVCFEESDGITVIGHTPEKDSYIGLLLALDMVMTLRKNLGEYLVELQKQYGYYFPEKDSVPVSQAGSTLHETLAGLDSYRVGGTLMVAGKAQKIAQVINIDGHKIILDDGGWLMIRPSGTEPKVRFYVEGRSAADTRALFVCARELLAEIGLLENA